MADLPFTNRTEAGRRLAQSLQHYQYRDDVIVLALPRGGVPVGYEIAQALAVPLDVMVVRKLGVPGHNEFAMGAIATGGIRLLMHEIIQAHAIDEESIADVVANEEKELLRRELAYRQSRPWPNLNGKSVILVDDGLATGATMRAAIAAVREYNAKKIIVAVPVAPADTAEAVASSVDEAIFLAVPKPFLAVGNWYRKFGQTSDEEVQRLLEQAWHSHAINA